MQSGETVATSGAVGSSNDAYEVRTASVDLIQLIETEIGSVPGVRSVDVLRDGSLLRVDISIKDLDYETCKPVYAKEIDFYDEFPDFDFQFNVVMG